VLLWKNNTISGGDLYNDTIHKNGRW